MKYEEDKKIKVEKLCRQRKGGGGGMKGEEREKRRGGGNSIRIFSKEEYTPNPSPCLAHPLTHDCKESNACRERK